MDKKPLSFVDQIREAVKTSGQSRYGIARATGIPESFLCRFVHGQAGAGTETTLNKLAAYLGLRVVVDRKAAGKKAKVDRGLPH